MCTGKVTGFVTFFMVSSPVTEKFDASLLTIDVERNVIVGYLATSK